MLRLKLQLSPTVPRRFSSCLQLELRTLCSTWLLFSAPARQRRLCAGVVFPLDGLERREQVAVSPWRVPVTLSDPGVMKAVVPGTWIRKNPSMSFRPSYSGSLGSWMMTCVNQKSLK